MHEENEREYRRLANDHSMVYKSIAPKASHRCPHGDNFNLENSKNLIRETEQNIQYLEIFMNCAEGYLLLVVYHNSLH